MKEDKLDKIIVKCISDKDALKLAVFRSVKTKVGKMKNSSKKSIRKLPDEQKILQALKCEMKELKEENEINLEFNNSAKCKALCAQMSYLSPYLPVTLDYKETELLINKAIEKAGKKMSSIMKYLKKSGKVIDMKLASELVKEKIK